MKNCIEMVEYLSSLLPTASTKVLTMCAQHEVAQSIQIWFVTLDGGLSHLFVHVVVNEIN